MKYETIEVESKGDIAIIILNRPEKHNAISIKMRQEISAALKQLNNSDSPGCLIITGSGRTFSAGFDLTEFKKPELFGELYESSAQYHRDVWNFPLPTIAAINGPAMAGGFDLATLCDIRICSQTAVFSHPEIKLGYPPVFTPLRWIIGEGLARDLCLTGRRIDAKEALRIGLVNEVVAEDFMLERARQIASTILEAPKSSLQFVKRYLTGNAGKDFEESFQIEHDRAFKEIILANEELLRL